MKTNERLSELKSKYKPKVMDVRWLIKNNVILTDTYNWRDFESAIEEVYKQALADFQEKVERVIDQLRRMVAEDGVRLLTGEMPKLSWMDAFDFLDSKIKKIGVGNKDEK